MFCEKKKMFDQKIIYFAPMKICNNTFALNGKKLNRCSKLNIITTIYGEKKRNTLCAYLIPIIQLRVILHALQ